MDELMTLGQFSARTRLSRKALRIYEAQELLLPVHVDPHSGYRFYSPDQVHRARLIGLLRRLDLPLERIAVMLDLPPDSAVKAIRSHWVELDERHVGRRELVRYLQDLLSERQDEMFEVKTRDMPRQKVIGTQRHLTADQLPAFIDEAHGKLSKHLTGSGATVEGRWFVIYHGVVDETSDGPVEVALPFSGAVEPHEDLGVRLEPARTEAYTTLPKSLVRFPDILRGYDAVERWLNERQLTVVLSPREVYFAADWDLLGDDEPACDIAFPFTLAADLESAGRP